MSANVYNMVVKLILGLSILITQSAVSAGPVKNAWAAPDQSRYENFTPSVLESPDLPHQRGQSGKAYEDELLAKADVGRTQPIDISAAEIKLSFGVYTADKPTVVVRKFKPLLKLLERSVGNYLGQTVKIKLQVASTYAAGIDDISSGKVDFSRLGPASYIESKGKQPAIQILALEALDGNKRFNGVISVGAESSIKSIADLKGKRFAFGDEGSTIGRFLAQQYLFEHGLIASDLGHYDYLDRHDKVGTAVALGQYDAGALKESTYRRLVENGAALRVLATITDVVTKPWIARAGLDDRIVTALRASLLEVTDPIALKALRKDGFVEGNDGDYAVIRRSIDENSQFFN